MRGTRRPAGSGSVSPPTLCTLFLKASKQIAPFGKIMLAGGISPNPELKIAKDPLSNFIGKIFSIASDYVL